MTSSHSEIFDKIETLESYKADNTEWTQKRICFTLLFSFFRFVCLICFILIYKCIDLSFQKSSHIRPWWWVAPCMCHLAEYRWPKQDLYRRETRRKWYWTSGWSYNRKGRGRCIGSRARFSWWWLPGQPSLSW